jgi:regulation of enolase protein 1 (concanavalin A-like superfamily)
MDMSNWKWLNESRIIKEGGEVVIHAPGHTDWFNNPVPQDGVLSAPVANAPFFYTEVTGDFVFRAKVRPNFKTVYDACALMVIQDENMWTKAAFEKSDFGTTAAVCVVTDGVSDDANGCNIDQEEAWLQIVRVGDVFCTHYSLDGEHFYMVRLFRLPVEKTVKVGIEAQSPAGEGGLRFYSDITLENCTVKNLRAGI